MGSVVLSVRVRRQVRAKLSISTWAIVQLTAQSAAHNVPRVKSQRMGATHLLGLSASR